jgi:hypothetical protein
MRNIASISRFHQGALNGIGQLIFINNTHNKWGMAKVTRHQKNLLEQVLAALRRFDPPPI